MIGGTAILTIFLPFVMVANGYGHTATETSIIRAVVAEPIEHNSPEIDCTEGWFVKGELSSFG